jgi:hypothetical protein
VKLTGSLEVDARNLVPCPRCGERSGAKCFTPSGAVSNSTHAARYELLTQLFDPRIWAINSETRTALLSKTAAAEYFRLPLDLEV